MRWFIILKLFLHFELSSNNCIIRCKLINNFFSGFCRYHPTKLDVETFNSVGDKPSPKYSNVLRWYNHINGFGSEKSKFPDALASLGNGKYYLIFYLT